jgi:hypothetical protein
MALVKKENNPKVIRFKGSEIIFRTGFTIKKSSDNAKPPIKKFTIPPWTLRPETNWTNTNKDMALKMVFLSIDFILQE